MKHTALYIALLGTCGLVACNGDDTIDPIVTAVEFVGMGAPATAAEKADVYTKAQVILTYSNLKTKTVDLQYYMLMGTGDTLSGKVVGGIQDANDQPINDANGQLAYDAPDGTSLLSISGLNAADPANANALAMVNHFEYRELPPAGQTGSFWSKLPAGMGLTILNQSKVDGKLTAASYSNISFASVGGLWIPCNASTSPWNTHLGSEEYEPDAKVRGGGVKAADSDDGTDIDSFSKYYFGAAATANPYRYGLVPEITVGADGKATVVKHYALGRFARELADVMPDRKTVYMGDDGKATGLFMFIADKSDDLSAGTLYAGKWVQKSKASGGSADLKWIRLGAATDAEVRALVDGGIKFRDIFDASVVDPKDASFKKVQTYSGTEWLRLKPGAEKAAAFLETRRYAAYLGATTEFTKMEGVAHNAKDKKAYIVISRTETTMLADAAAPADDIQLDRNDGGAIYELPLADGVKDTAGNAIGSAYVATAMNSIVELLGGWNGGAKDAEGNQCAQDKVCGGDNIRFMENARTLLIGEDTSRRNNNYVWAFNIDNRKLARILSVPMNAEATGLHVVEDLNGFSYITSNFQHPGEDRGSPFGSNPLANYTGADRAEVLAQINSKWNNRHRAAIGYIGTKEGGALPAIGR
jgi:secreted PhoX family phosphatase